jgi:hypothetical protein
VAIEGPLKELGIHDVFQLLDLSRKTGVLRVRSEIRQNAGMVYFEKGGVIGAEIRSNPHPLGGLLLRNGKISEEDLTRSRAMHRSEEKYSKRRRVAYQRTVESDRIKHDAFLQIFLYLQFCVSNRAVLRSYEANRRQRLARVR